MIGEAEAYKDFIIAHRNADGNKKKAPRTAPPSLSPPLQQALDEVHLVHIGYKTGIELKDMEYHRARIRMIAASIHSLLNSRMF